MNLYLNQSIILDGKITRDKIKAIFNYYFGSMEQYSFPTYVNI